MSRRLTVAGITVAGVVLLGLVATSLVLALGLRSQPAATGAAVTVSPATAGAPDTLTVVGEGKGVTTPDTATLSLGATATRGNVTAALNSDNADMKKLLAALKAQGVGDSDIQTTAINVNQVTSGCCPPTVTGYSASNSVNVTVHHLANVGPVIQAVVGAVGNDVTIGGINLSIADPSVALGTARKAAMNDAGVRAQVWAGLSGRKLGHILSVSEVVGTGGSQPVCSSMCGGAGGGPGVSGGEATVTVDITVTYELTG